MSNSAAHSDTGTVRIGDAALLRTLFPGDDEAATLARATRWSETALGAPSGWSAELCSALRTVMPSRVPMLVWWGTKLVQIYNEAYRPFLGSKHPTAMGQPAAVCWAEVWDHLSPMTTRVLQTGEATFDEDLLLFIERHGYLEETYWTFSYSPIRSADQEVLGVFVATTDVTTARVNARRLITIRDLAVLSSADFDTPTQAVSRVCDILQNNRQAVPFAAVYLAEPSGDLVAHSHYGVRLPSSHLPARIGADAHHPLADIGRSREPAVHNYVPDELAADPGPLGPKVPDAAYLMPLGAAGRPLDGVLVLGLNPYRWVDERYTTFVTLVTRQLTALLTDVRVTAVERARATALAELDRNKSAFFANVSHEFRTPITVALSATSELQGSGLTADQALHVEAVQRAATRLNRLVDTLLDFARAEAGTLTPVLESVDVAESTLAVLAMFRSSIESAGLELTVDVDDVGLLLIDRESWIKVVGNLLSNAYKFTPEGRITVALRRDDQELTLSVADTGTGISVQEAEGVFARFRQASSQPVRGIRGTGIGLALVKDLVDAQGGRVDLDSTPGRGTTVTVRLPSTQPTAEAVPPPETTKAPQAQASHLAPVEAATVVGSLLQELASPGMSSDDVEAPSGRQGPRVMLVEDNADLRGYLTRLLTSDGWAVSAVPDVPSALQVDHLPDLLVCDVMLPGPSGLDLVRLIRSQQEWVPIPVVLLTARSGPREVAEGLSSGADDYISKPFQPVEFLSRLRAHYELARDRNRRLVEAEDRAANLAVALTTSRQIGVAVGVVMSREKVTSERAFQILREHSNRTNQRLRTIAEWVALTGELADVPSR